MKDTIAHAAIAMVVGLASSAVGIKVSLAELTVRVNELSAGLDRTEIHGAMLYENKLAINNAERSITYLQAQLGECMRRDVAQGAHESLMGRLQALEHDRNWFGRMVRGFPPPQQGAIIHPID